MQRCSTRDRNQFGQRVIDDQGYLTAHAVIGRCGIQVYTRGELGLDGDQSAPMRLMRTPEEVFRPETIASFENKPICDEHPPKGVDATTWKERAIGGMRDIVRQTGDLLGARVLVMDRGGVQTVVGGKDYLSCGYNFDLDLTPGETVTGEKFDGYQRNILGDHAAIVSSPRGGPVCRIQDKKHQEHIMETRKIAVDGLPPFEVDELAAGAIEAHIRKITGDRDAVVSDFATHVKDSKAKMTAKDAVIAEKDKTIATRDAEIMALKENLEKAKAIDVDAFIAERVALVEKARQLAPAIEIKGGANDVRKAAIVAACEDSINKSIVNEIVGPGGIDKATEYQIKTAFGVLLALPKQAALAAQDAAVGRALGAGPGGMSAITGPVERL